MIYLDNNATTPIRPEVYEAMVPYLTEEFGNPSSKYYPLAAHAKDAVENAREKVAALIGARPEEIVFTAGSTESTNMIIKGVADYKKHYEGRGNHIITSKVEHKATLNVCKFLNGDIYSNTDASFSFSGAAHKVDRGYDVTFLDVNQYGQVLPDDLAVALRPTTTLASFIWGNNEIGTLNDITSLSAICKKSGVELHTDATQVLGKCPIDVSGLGVSYMSMSAHKLYGPKGVGAAYIKGDDYGLPPLSALLHGGEQENGLRGSTLAVHDIVGFGKAAELAMTELNATQAQYKQLDEVVIHAISQMEDISLLGSLDHRLPGVYSIIVKKPSFHNERFLKKISDQFALSTGSACSAGQPSHVLHAIGLGEYTGNVIRVSVSPNTPASTIKRLLELL